jgi:hypothetical protein
VQSLIEAHEQAETSFMGQPSVRIPLRVNSDYNRIEEKAHGRRIGSLAVARIQLRSARRSGGCGSAP